MRTRIATLALSAAAALAAAGCGSKCNDQTPPVSSVPTSTCTALTGTPVTMPIHVCPKCDQGSPSCLVHTENVGQGQITLEPVSEVCDPNSSCPLVDTSTPDSCPFATLNCQFTAPAVGEYTIVVVTPSAPENRHLTVVASGSTSCGFP